MGALTSCLAARLHDLSSPRPPGGVTVSILTDGNIRELAANYRPITLLLRILYTIKLLPFVSVRVFLLKTH